MGAVYCGVLDNCISTTLRFEYDLAFLRINLPSIINFQCLENITHLTPAWPRSGRFQKRASLLGESEETNHLLQHT